MLAVGSVAGERSGRLEVVSVFEVGRFFGLTMASLTLDVKIRVLNWGLKAHSQVKTKRLKNRFLRKLREWKVHVSRGLYFFKA